MNQTVTTGSDIFNSMASSDFVSPFTVLVLFRILEFSREEKRDLLPPSSLSLFGWVNLPNEYRKFFVYDPYKRPVP